MCYMGFLPGNVTQGCLLHESVANLYLGIFLLKCHIKFCIYYLLGVIFISSVHSWFICVINKRGFSYDADVLINHRGCDL